MLHAPASAWLALYTKECSHSFFFLCHVTNFMPADALLL